MAVSSSVNAFVLQFVADALRTASSRSSVVDLTMESDRKKLATYRDILDNGHLAKRNPDGTGMTIAQIATAANLTVAQVTEIAGGL